MTRKKTDLSRSISSGQALAREKLEGRVVGGRFSELANYADLFDRAHDGIGLVDVRNFEVLETNSVFQALTKADGRKEGATVFDFFPDADATEFRNWFTNAKGSFELKTHDSRAYELSVARVWLADYCEVFQLLVRDITKEHEKRNLLERQSLTDEMTGLSNFRAFQGRLALEHERAEKKNLPYCVLFFDVDHFKHFNDRNGHPAGDDALRKVAEVLRSVSSRTEFVARYGGEEFVVLTSGTDLEQGRAFAERARIEIENTKFPFGEHQPLGKVSVSIGVAVFEPGIGAEEMLKRADQALYESKQSGRNRVTAFLSEKSALAYLLKKKTG
jgi:diguanylate cyclase (GGDEF)-like protein